MNVRSMLPSKANWPAIAALVLIAVVALRRRSFASSA